ncbi:hypothetical protein ACLOJK_006134 [Asimina triloba]
MAARLRHCIAPADHDRTWPTLLLLGSSTALTDLKLLMDCTIAEDAVHLAVVGMEGEGQSMPLLLLLIVVGSC